MRGGRYHVKKVTSEALELNTENQAELLDLLGHLKSGERYIRWLFNTDSHHR